MASRGLVAFLGGAATKQSEILDEQRKLKQEEERQRLLLQLREEAEIRAANHADSLARKRTDRNLSGVDGDYFVYRDNDGNETHRRSLTPDEIAAREAAKDDKAWDRDYKERQLALTRRAQDISDANSRRAAASRARGGSGSDEDTDPTDMYGILRKSVYENVGKSLDELVESAEGGISRATIDQALDNMIYDTMEGAMNTGRLDSSTLIRNARDYISTVNRIPEKQRPQLQVETFRSRPGGPSRSRPRSLDGTN